PGICRGNAGRGRDLGHDRIVSLLVYADETLDALLQPRRRGTRGASTGYRLGRRGWTTRRRRVGPLRGSVPLAAAALARHRPHVPRGLSTPRASPFPGHRPWRPV